MLHTVMLAIVAQTALTADDVPSMVKAVVEHTTAGSTHHPVYVAEESADAFRDLLPPGVTVVLADLAASYRVRQREAVLDCRTSDNCSVTNGGLLITVASVATGHEPGNEMLSLGAGEYMLAVTTTPPQHTPTAHRPADAAVYLTLAEKNGAWQVIDTIVPVF